MPRMEPVEFRCPLELRRQAAEQAARHGISLSELCRQSLIFTLAWTAACDAMNAGMDPRHLTNLQRVAEELTRLTSASDS